MVLSACRGVRVVTRSEPQCRKSEAALNWTQWALVAAMFLASAIAWPLAPDQIPVHWNLSGQVDRYSGKVEGLLLLPFMALGIVLLLRLLPRIDPMRERYAEFGTAYALAGVAIVALLAVVQAMLLLWTFGVQFNAGLVVGVAVGGLLIVLGFVLGDVRRNWFMGVRTPWTLSSERSWNQTHRQARWVFQVMGGVVILASILESAWALTTVVVVCLAGALWLVVYSYLVWRADPDRDRVS
jgi:uncharacterized membrane protein